MLIHAARWMQMALWYAQPRARQIARNAQRLYRLVIAWDHLLARSREGRGPGRHGLIFTHIPKTGGTTLEYIIAKNYLINGVIQINSPALHRNPNALFKGGDMPRVVMGHHNLNHILYHWIDRPIAHITILREPVARIVSHFNYVKTSPNHALYSTVKDMTLAQYAESDASIELDNAQTLRLAGMLPRKPGSRRTDDPRALEIAKETLVRRISVFGVTERYVEFLLMCREVLGWEDIFALRRNVSAGRESTETIDPAVRNRLTSRNDLDCALYGFARELFDARAVALGIGDGRVSDYIRANDAWTALLRDDHPPLDAGFADQASRTASGAVR